MRKILYAIGAVVVVAVVVWYLSSRSIQYSTTNTPTEVLNATNPDFVLGNDLARAGDYAGAETAYTLALQKAADLTQESHIKLYLGALKYIQQKDPVVAIQIFKDVARNEANRADTRAAAVEWLATINEQHADPAIAADIFTGVPYTTMLVQGDQRLSARHLAEYASSLYPLGLAEGYIAAWYARELRIAPSSPDAMSYVSMVEAKLKSMDEHIEVLKTLPPEHSSVPYILMQKAIVVGDMTLAGIPYAQNPEDLFAQAFQSTKEYNSALGWDGFLHLHNALFLMKMHGAERTADIHTLLTPLSTDPYKNARIAIYLKNIRSGAFDLERTRDVAALAKIDSDFKALLTSIGWQAGDFTR